nr:unnamed protein product [Callosobruchus chinensis]
MDAKFLYGENIQKKTTRGSWEETSMRLAVEEIINKRMGYRKAAQQFCVPQTTLERRVKEYGQGNRTQIQNN